MTSRHLSDRTKLKFFFTIDAFFELLHSKRVFSSADKLFGGLNERIFFPRVQFFANFSLFFTCSSTLVFFGVANSGFQHCPRRARGHL